MKQRRFHLGILSILALLLALSSFAADPPAKPAKAGGKGDVEIVERLLAARKEYQATLETLRAHYIGSGDIERARWAQDELVQYHRIAKRAFRLELDVPPPTLSADKNIPEANELFRQAMKYKNKGISWSQDYKDNQHRAELLFQQLLTNYPQSNKLSDAAYHLGDLYEGSVFRQYERAAKYFERCFQWNPKTHFDARLRAARLYERYQSERTHAIEIYKEITTTEGDAKRVEEAQKRLTALSGKTR